MDRIHYKNYIIEKTVSGYAAKKNIIGFTKFVDNVKQAKQIIDAHIDYCANEGYGQLSDYE